LPWQYTGQQAKIKMDHSRRFVSICRLSRNQHRSFRPKQEISHINHPFPSKAVGGAHSSLVELLVPTWAHLVTLVGTCRRTDTH
jgi:hypothetical protein